MSITPLTLGADSVRTEVADAPDAHDLTPAQAGRIAALGDDAINQAVRQATDDVFWEIYDDVRRSAIAELAKVPLTHVITLDGDDYETAVDAANAGGGSTEAIVAYLSGWDYGAETDSDSEVNGNVDLADLERWRHQLHEADHGGLHYWLVLDHGLRCYSLYRKPLG